MDLEQLRTNIIQASLKPLSLWSPEAEALLCATAAQESLGGKFVIQVGGGPGCGIFQMEIKTHDLIWRVNLSRADRLPLVRAMLNMFNFSRIPKAQDMIWHLGYATFMARIFYLVINNPLPKTDDLDAQWAFYKLYWNTEKGAAKKEDFFRNVKKFTGIKK